MSYRVCEADTLEKLQDQVNRYIREGWQPLGGVAVVQSHQSANWWYHQALVQVGSKPVEAGDWDLA